MGILCCPARTYPTALPGDAGNKSSLQVHGPTKSMSRPQALHMFAQQYLNNGRYASGQSFLENQRSAVSDIISMQQISEFAIASGRRLRAVKPMVWGHSNGAEYNAGRGTVGLIAWQELVGYLCAALGFLAVTLLLWGSPLRRECSVLQVHVLKALCVQRTHFGNTSKISFLPARNSLMLATVVVVMLPSASSL